MQLNGFIRLSRFDMERIDRALFYVEQHYRKKISADQLAVEVTLSKAKLQAGLLRKTGSTLHDYILKVRLDQAKILLLETNQPVKSVAACTGFKTASHFIEIFKKHNSMTPNQYRLLPAI